MSFISRISNTAALLLRAAQTTDDVEEADAPTLPPRLSTSHDPLALSTVFRGVQIIETAVSKLPLIQYAPGRLAHAAEHAHHPARPEP